MSAAGRLRAVALVAAVLLLAGCAQIPTSGEVEPGTTEGPNDTTIVFVANPPAPGATPKEIVAGFLTAASAGGDFDVARKYLAATFATRWRPQTRVLVQEAQPTVSTTGPQDWTFEVPISGRLDQRGVYTPATRPVPLTFHLVQQNGQWRIDSAPDGIVLSQAVFQKVYQPQSLQFFDPGWTRLVPDVRWFPKPQGLDASDQQEAVLRALIAGPEGPLADGVVANALTGAKLRGVTDGDVTSVVLGFDGTEPSAAATDRMQQQILLSLQLRGPSALRLIVDGKAAAQVKELAAPTTSLNAYVLVDGRFGTMATNGTFSEEPALGPRIAQLSPEAVTVSPRQKLAAVLTASDEVAIVGATGGPRIVDRRAGLVAPSMDQRGWVYSVPSDSPSGLRAFDAKGDGIDLFGNLGSATVRAIEVSPDGTRLLVLTDAASGLRAFVAGIERNADGTPTGLTAARYAVATEGARGIDATWVDTASVAVLSDAGDGTTQRVHQQQLGAGDQSLGELANATSIVGTLNSTYLRVRLQSGDLWTLTSNLWQQQGPRPVDVSVLAVQR